MTAAEIAMELEGAHRSGAWWRCRCPVHNSAGATLALRDEHRGLIAVCHGRCPRRNILAELRRRGLTYHSVSLPLEPFLRDRGPKFGPNGVQF